MLKKLGSVLLVLVCFFSIGNSALADYTYYYSWTDTAGSYGPDSGKAYNRIRNGGCLDYVDFRSYSIDYTYSEIQAIKNYYNNNSYYHGLDATDTSGSSVVPNNLGYDGWHAENYPKPHFDTDDDNNDGRAEETEFVTLEPWNMSDTASYYYYVDFKFYNGVNCTDSSRSGYLELNSHESNKPWYAGGEYQTQQFSPLKTMYYKGQ